MPILRRRRDDRQARRCISHFGRSAKRLSYPAWVCMIHVHTIRIEEMHSAARKLLRTFSPQEKYNMNVVAFSYAVLIRAVSNWAAACRNYVLRIVGDDDNGGRTSETTQSTPRRFRAFNMWCKHRYEELKRNGDPRVYSEMMPTLHTEWESLEWNTKAMWEQRTEDARRAHTSNRRLNRSGNQEGQQADAVTTRNEESFLARPPWSIGDQENWLKPNDLDDLLKHGTTRNLEHDPDYYKRFVIEPFDWKLPIQSSMATCME